MELRDLLVPRTRWRRLRVLIEGISGDTTRWNVSDYLLASAVDALNAGNWQRGGAKGKRPKAVPRPGSHGQRRFGTGRFSIEHMQKILDRANKEGVTDGD